MSNHIGFDPAADHREVTNIQTHTPINFHLYNIGFITLFVNVRTDKINLLIFTNAIILSNNIMIVFVVKAILMI